MEREEGFFVTFKFIISFVSMMVLYGRERGTYVQEGVACMEEKELMSRSVEGSMEGWEEGLGRLLCCFIYTPVFTVGCA